MSTATPIDELLIEKLRIYLKGEGYSGRVQRWYPARARHFLDYCNDNTLAVEAVGDVPHSVENGEAVAAMVTIPAHAASSSIRLFELFDALA